MALKDKLMTLEDFKTVRDVDVASNQTQFTAIKADLADVTNHAVKSAEQLISDKRTVDKLPYKYRASASGKSDRAYDMIVGGTMCFNQLVNISQVDASKTQNGVTITDNRNGTYTVSTDANGATANTYSSLSNANVVFKSGHKYLFYGTPSTGSANTYYSYLAGTMIVYDYGKGVVFAVPTDGVATPVIAYIKQGTVITTPVTFKQQCFDLTLMLGSTIADYIYQLEQTKAGDGVAFFKALFPNEYYAYNAGSLISVAGLSAKEVVGFNLFDDEAEFGRISTSTGEPQTGLGIRSKNFIPIIPSETYYFTRGAYQNSNVSIIMYYDSDKNYMSWYNLSAVSREFVPPVNARFIKWQVQTAQNVTTYNHDICISLSSNKNGTYEPYHKTTYPLDSSLTLRGVPVLKDDKIEFDGDIYASDGTVTRKYAERAYQSGDESLANAITDGTNTVYKLSAETTETATPYTSPQVVNPYGTEEYISETICPVGHITEYPDNLRAKIDGLPWDLSMIAPVETAYTATRNYTVNQLLIVDNTLYKVTSNIANGEAITPNSNVTATTLSEVISALA